MPVPEYWIDVTLPIAACAACKTVVAVLGVLQPATPTITPANSQSFPAMFAPFKKDVDVDSKATKPPTDYEIGGKNTSPASGGYGSMSR
jgi:hypothetical protein